MSPYVYSFLADLSHNLSQEHRNFCKVTLCKQQRVYVVCGSRSVHVRCKYAPSCRPVVHLRSTEPIVGQTFLIELSHTLSQEHCNHAAAALCKERGTCHDVCGSRSAHVRCKYAPLSRPVVHLRSTEKVLEQTFQAE
jgi:hypothetical protein